MSRNGSAPLLLAAAGFLLSVLVAFRSSAERPRAGLTEASILGADDGALRVRQVITRVTAFDQTGHGYQSQDGPILGPGSERLTVLEPQVEVVATQGPRVTHRITVPIDVITAASADAIDRHRSAVDVVSHASRINFAGTFDWLATYRTDRASEVSLRSGVHLAEPFRSWHAGMSASHGFEGGATVISGSALAVFDWFDNFTIQGYRHGRTNRSSTTGSVGVTRILTEGTLVDLNYGLTVQRGELGNGWNVVPLSSGLLGDELLPGERVRHALVLRASQFLPWNGALRLHYRLYGDDWGVVAQTASGELLQRLSPALYVGATYRFHRQTGPDFFTTRGSPDALLRTADSDLSPLDAHTVGGRVVLDVPLDARIRVLHFDLAYERYFRTNDLQINVVTWATGYRF